MHCSLLCCRCSEVRPGSSCSTPPPRRARPGGPGAGGTCAHGAAWGGAGEGGLGGLGGGGSRRGEWVGGYRGRGHSVRLGLLSLCLRAVRKIPSPWPGGASAPFLDAIVLLMLPSRQVALPDVRLCGGRGGVGGYASDVAAMLAPGDLQGSDPPLRRHLLPPCGQLSTCAVHARCLEVKGH
jgi:hypothetical protein